LALLFSALLFSALLFSERGRDRSQAPVRGRANSKPSVIAQKPSSNLRKTGLGGLSGKAAIPTGLGRRGGDGNCMTQNAKDNAKDDENPARLLPQRRLVAIGPLAAKALVACV